MPVVAQKKEKKNTYAIMAVVIAVVIVLLLAFPFMNDSSSSSHMPYQFTGKPVNLRSIASDFILESQSGSPLDEAKSSSTLSSLTAPTDGSDYFASSTGAASGVGSGAASASAPGVSAGAGGYASVPKGKLAPSTGLGSGGGSSSAKGEPTQLFGSGNKKVDFANLSGKDLDKAPKTAGRGRALASLKHAADLSKGAASNPNSNAMKGGALSAFERTDAKASLNTDMEKSANKAGAPFIDPSKSLSGLKDDTSSKKKIEKPDVPEPEKDSGSSENQAMDQNDQNNANNNTNNTNNNAWVTSLMQSMMGPIFGAIGNSIANSICPSGGSGGGTTSTQ